MKIKENYFFEKVSIKQPVLCISISNPRRLKQPGLIIETIAYSIRFGGPAECNNKIEGTPILKLAMAKDYRSKNS